MGMMGWRVGLLARREHLLEQVAAEVTRRSGEACILKADVSRSLDVARAVDRIQACWGGVDVLVNAAGFGAYGLVEESEVRDFERIMKVNYLGSVHLTKSVLPIFLRQNAGCIVNICSISGRIPGLAVAPYAASKAALETFSSALRLELAGTRIKVVTVVLGGTRTDYFKAMIRRRPISEATLTQISERYMPVGDAASAIVKLIAHPRREVFLPSKLRFYAAVYALFPGFVDRLLLRFRQLPSPALMETNLRN
jgi:short-subunit dehydrogenase